MEIPTFTYVKVQLVSTNAIGIIKYNRPQSGNSLHPTLLLETLKAFQWMDSQQEIAVIILTGEGRFFCTGMELLEHNTEKPMSFAHGSDFHLLNKLLILSKKILIAAVNGPAAGYGVSSLALFDLVYCVPDAYFFTPFVKWGMAAEGASSFSFPRLMGHHKAAGLFLAGERISASEAERLGLVNKIMPRQGFVDSVVALANGIAQTPRGALHATKALMKEPVLQGLLEANDRECALIHKERYGSVEYLDAIREFKVEQERKRQLKPSL
jgi:peroxisomal 3,2-trans-enoyl-CoA isomerase